MTGHRYTRGLAPGVNATHANTIAVLVATPVPKRQSRRRRDGAILIEYPETTDGLDEGRSDYEHQPGSCWVTDLPEDDEAARYADLPSSGGDVTFAMLVDSLDEMMRTDRLSKAECANLKSAARRYMGLCNVAPDDPIGPSLTSEFEASLKRFERLAGNPPAGQKGLGGKSLPGYRSRLRTLHRLAVAMVGDPEPFAATLNRAIDTWIAAKPGRDLTKIAEIAGVKRTTFLTWRHGRTPNPTPVGYEQARKLEVLFGLQLGSLSRKIIDRRDVGAKVAAAEIRAAANEPGKMPDYTRINYIPKVDNLPPLLSDFYEKLAAYKTANYAGRTIDGRALRRNKRTRAKAKDWTRRFHSLAGGILGWLTLPSTLDGARTFVRNNMRDSLRPDQVDLAAPFLIGHGMSLADVTPCHMVDPALVGKFLEWKTKRAGTESQFHQSFFMHVKALTKPIEGFLAQQPEFTWAYFRETPIVDTQADWQASYRRSLEKWEEVCGEWHSQLKDMARDVNRHAKSRDPKVELAAILNDGAPMRHVFGIIRSHAIQRRDGTLDPSSHRRVTLAAWWRDEFLLRLLATNPLRSRNLRQMTWKADNTGNLYKGGNCWRIRFQPADFKNEAGAARYAYDVPTADMLAPVIDTYIKRARPILLKGEKTDAVFISQTGKAFVGAGISNLVDRMSRPYRLKVLPTVKALRCHAFRHIVATAWLKANPGQYRAVASILHDTLETVLKNYDHSDPAQGLAQWAEWLAISDFPPARKTD